MKRKKEISDIGGSLLQVPIHFSYFFKNGFNRHGIDLCSNTWTAVFYANLVVTFRMSLDLQQCGLDLKRYGIDVQRCGLDLWQFSLDLWQ